MLWFKLFDHICNFGYGHKLYVKPAKRARLVVMPLSDNGLHIWECVERENVEFASFLQSLIDCLIDIKSLPSKTE